MPNNADSDNIDGPEFHVLLVRHKETGRLSHVETTEYLASRRGDWEVVGYTSRANAHEISKSIADEAGILKERNQ